MTSVDASHWRVRGGLVLFSFLVTACMAPPSPVAPSSPGPPTATPSVHFITFASPEEIEEEMRATPTVPGGIRMQVYMTAEAQGELTLVNGCLYIQAVDAPSRQLLIWPPELYAVDEREGTVRILDARSGEELVRVGDRIRVGGGQLAYEHLSDRVRAQLPTDCPGPYWAVGLGLERWEPTPTPGAPGGYTLTSGSPDEIVAEPTPDPEAASDPEATTIILAGEEALRRDAQEYARMVGISLDEALRRLAIQESFEGLRAELEEKERDTFAGLWIQHTPKYRIVVRFTRDGEETIQRYIAGHPHADIVEVRGADLTRAELEAILYRASHVVDALPSSGGAKGLSVNVKENRAEVWVDDRAVFEAALQEAGLQLPEHVVVLELGERGNP